MQHLVVIHHQIGDSVSVEVAPMMQQTVVLNLLYKPRPYSPSDVETIQAWIDYFRSRDSFVVVTPPLERADIIDTLSGYAGNGVLPVPVSSFDTCDRWQAGLRAALEHWGDAKLKAHRLYLWAADYAFSEPSRFAAECMIEHRGTEELLVGTIEATGVKAAIDEYATLPLLRCWFPEECSAVHDKGLLHPRSELLGLSAPFIRMALARRWYPTEQTVHLILQCLWNGHSVIGLPMPNLSDDNEARTDNNVVLQVQRLELWLKYMWCSHNSGWTPTEFLSRSSESQWIAAAACRQLLRA